MPSKKQTQTKAQTTTKKTTAKKVVAKKTTIKKATVKKVATKKASAKKTVAKKKAVKKVAAKKVPAKKAPVRKKAVKKAPARKQPPQKARTAQQYERVTLEELFDGIDFEAAERKHKKSVITLADLFEDVGKSQPAFSVKDSVARTAPTTPAYSQIIRSTLPRPTDKHKAEDGARVLFEQEQGEFFERLNVFHKLAMSLGVAIFMIVVGGLWFQVTKGYFEETSQNQDSAVELLQDAAQRNKEQFQEVTSQMQQRVQMVQQEIEANEELQQEIKLISEELRKQLQEQNASNDTTQH